MAAVAAEAAPAVEQTTPVATVAPAPESAMSEQPTQGISTMEQLHRLCAEGDVMGARAILSRSLEYLESIDPVTGNTPMLQAVYNNRTEVVAELLRAGAYPPPPSTTQDPSILALILPAQQPFPIGSPPGHFQPMPVHGNGMHSPPPQNQGPGPEGAFYSPIPPQAFMPMGGQEGHHAPPFVPYGMQHAGPQRRRDGKEGNGVLPPTEQAKQIPCRNFPNCRFGAACHFLHPPTAFFPQQGFVPFDPRFMAGSGRPDGYYMQPPPPAFQPASPAGTSELHQSGSLSSSGSFNATAASFVPPAQPSPQPTSSSEGSSVPVASAPAFVPAQASEAEAADQTVDASRSHDAAGAAGAAASTNGGRPSFSFQNGSGLPHVNGFDRKAGMHAKKASMSRMGGMATRQMLLGTWNHGQPPACVFFLANKCRNGDMCKFPHIMPDGSDSRHPDVINGSLPANPVSLVPRAPKGRNGMNGGFGYGNPAQTQRVQGMQAARPAVQAPIVDGAAQTSDSAAAESSGKATGETAAVADSSKASSPSTDTAAPRPTTRSVPNTRAHSPTHGGAAGGPRAGRFGRGGSQTGIAGARSTSIPPAPAKQMPKQRVPGAEEFPALSGSTGSLASETAKPVQPIANGKTAAQVLAEPAPVPAPAPAPAPVSAAVADSETSDSKAEEPLVRTLSGSSSVRGVETRSEDDAVLISQLPATNSPSKTSATRPGIRAGISFASITSSATSVPESAPIPLQA